MVDRKHRSRLVGAAMIAGTSMWNVAQNGRLPRLTYPWLNGAAALVIPSIGRRIGLTTSDLGLGRAAALRGAVVGGSVAATGAGILMALSRSRFRHLLSDSRVVGVSRARLAYEVGFRIPIGTALFEEMLFRGLILGWLAVERGACRGAARSSTLFGLWHVLPTLEATKLHRAGAARRAGGTRVTMSVLAGVGTTVAAGRALAGLRLRTGSLVAPLIVHSVVNSAAYAAAWAVARTPQR